MEHRSTAMRIPKDAGAWRSAAPGSTTSIGASRRNGDGTRSGGVPPTTYGTGIRGDHGIERENVKNDAIGALTQLADRPQDTQVLQAIVGGLPPSKVRRVIAFIENNLNRQLRLEELAAVTHMSPSHFARLFKRATGISPHRFLVPHP